MDNSITPPVPPPGPPARRRRHEPTLIPVGKMLRSSDGRFHPHLCANWLRDNARNQWKTIAELARMFATNTEDGRRRVRRNMPAVFAVLLDLKEFLVYETTGSYRQITAVKLLDARSDLERDAANPQLERMKQRNEISGDKFERALEVIAFKRGLAGQ